MRLHPALLVAVVWAVGVLGFYFAAINWLPPFENWSLSDRIQLFQGAVGLAGFGGGLIALTFAAQHLAPLLADPKLVVSYRVDGGSFTGGDVSGERTGEDSARLILSAEIVNRSDSICALWQVAVSAPPGGVVVGGEGWANSVTGEQASYQAGPKEALYPDCPHPLGGVVLVVSRGPVVGDLPGGWSWSRRVTTRVTTQRRTREQRLDIRLLVPPPRETLSDDDLGTVDYDYPETT